jgi:hypothetical protein
MQRSAFVASVVVVAVGCGRHEASPKLGAARNAMVIDDQHANTFPTGTVFSPGGLRFVAYAGADPNHLVNIVSSPAPPAGADAVWSPPQIFSDDQVNGNGAVSITQFNGKLFYAFNGLDRQINIRSSADGLTWTKEVVANATTPFAPMLVAHKGRLVVAFTGESPGELNVFSSPDGNFHGDANLDNKVVLGQLSNHAPAIASYNGKLNIGWTGTGAAQLNWAEVGDFGASGLQNQTVINDTSDDGVGLLGLSTTFIVSWRGSGNENLNVAGLNVDQVAALAGQTNVDFPVGAKTTLSDVSAHTPTFANFGPGAAMVWTGIDQHVNVSGDFFSRVMVCTDGTISSTDTDGDGLLDCWEDQGIDFDGDGVADLDLAGKGADKNHRDAFIELDYFDCTVAGGDCGAPGGMVDTHNHKPQAASINAVIAAFAAGATKPNPDGTTGVHLVIDVDEALVHQNVCDLNQKSTANPPQQPCYLPIRQASFGTAAEHTSPNAANILGAKALAYHYSLWVHDQSASFKGSTGIAHICSPDFLVSLGTPPPAGSTGETLAQQVISESSTLMHEFGHNLNLRHGGFEDTNFKPNYVSVMNYAFQPTGLLPFTSTSPPPGVTPPTLFATRSINYSIGTANTLSETGLLESAGVSYGSFWTSFTCPNGSANFARADGTTIDWDCGSQPAANNVISDDANGDRFCVTPGGAALQTTTTSGDDLFMGGEIDPPAGGVLTTKVAAGSDDFVAPNGSGQLAIFPGPDGILQSMSGFKAPDVATSVQIADGPDRICQTTAAAADTQVRAVGTVQETSLADFDDWFNIQLDFKNTPCQQNQSFGNGAPASDTEADMALRRIHDDVMALGRADLGIVETTSFQTTPTSSTFTVTFTATNAGPDDAIAPALNLTIPSGLSPVSCNGIPCEQVGDITVVRVHGLTAGAAVAVPVVLSVGCAVPTGTMFTLRAVIGDQPLDVNPANNTLSIPLTVGLRFQGMALYGVQGLRLAPGVVVDEHGGSGFGTLVNAGTSLLRLGPGAHVGDTWSVGSVELQPNAAVFGSLITNGTASIFPGASVSGGVQQGAAFSVPALTLSQTFPPPSGDVLVPSGTTVTLAPGSSGQVTVMPHGVLRLSAGTYFFDSFDVMPNARVEVDQTGGPVFVYVEASLSAKGAFVSVGGNAALLLVGYTGTAQVEMASPFEGTVVAPLATVKLGPGTCSGGFFASVVDVGPNTVIVHDPFCQ